MATAALKLVSDKPVTTDPLFFERRNLPRRRANGSVTAVLGSAESAEPAAGRICSLELLDMSATGVGVWSEQPLPVGTTITLYVPAHGPDSGFDLIRGRIASSAPAAPGETAGHRVGIRLYPSRTLAA